MRNNNNNTCLKIPENDGGEMAWELDAGHARNRELKHTETAESETKTAESETKNRQVWIGNYKSGIGN